MKKIYIIILFIFTTTAFILGQVNVTSSNGFVTIGELTNASDELHVHGDLRLQHDASNDASFLRFYNASTELLGYLSFDSPASTGTNRSLTNFKMEADYGNIELDAERELKFNTNDVTRAKFDNIGNFDFQGTHFLGWDEGTTRKAYLRYSGTHLYLENDETNGDIYIDGENEVRLYTDDIARVYVKKDGKVGIGTFAPTERLDVNGNITLEAGNRYAFDEGGVIKAGLAYNGVDMYLTNEEGSGIVNVGAKRHVSVSVNGVEHMRTILNGNTGIGVISPTEKLHVNGGIRLGAAVGNANGTIRYNGTDIQGRKGNAWVSLTQGGAGGSLWTASGSNAYFNSGNVGIGTTSPGQALQVNGNIGMTGEILGVSDVRTKKDIRQLDNALKTIKAMRPVSYEFNQDVYTDISLPHGKQMGFIAQEVEDILPGLVSKTTTGKNLNGQTDDLKGVNYIKLIPVLTKAIQEQIELIEAQKIMIESHAQSMEILQKEVAALKALQK